MIVTFNWHGTQILGVSLLYIKFCKLLFNLTFDIDVNVWLSDLWLNWLIQKLVDLKRLESLSVRRCWSSVFVFKSLEIRASLSLISLLVFSRNNSKHFTILRIYGWNRWRYLLSINHFVW